MAHLWGIGRKLHAPGGAISSSSRMVTTRSLALVAASAIRFLGVSLDEGGSSSFWPGGRGAGDHGSPTDADPRLQPKLRLCGYIVSPRLLAVLMGVRRAAEIGKNRPTTHAPGGESAGEFWIRDRWAASPPWRYLSRVSVPTRRIVALQTGGRGCDTRGSLTDVELSSPCAFAFVGHYYSSATAGVGEGAVTYGASSGWAPAGPMCRAAQFRAMREFLPSDRRYSSLLLPYESLVSVSTSGAFVFLAGEPNGR